VPGGSPNGVVGSALLATGAAVALHVAAANAGTLSPPYAYAEGLVSAPGTAGDIETSAGMSVSAGASRSDDVHPTAASFQCTASASGVLTARAEAESPVVVEKGQAVAPRAEARAEARFGDVLTFVDAGSPGSTTPFLVRIDFLVTGMLSLLANENPIGETNGRGRVEVFARVTPGSGAPNGFGDSIAIGVLGVEDPPDTVRSYGETISIGAAVTDGGSLPIAGEMRVMAEGRGADALAAFDSTLEPVAVIVPDGVTWTSESGLFFGSSAPTSSTSTTVSTGSTTTTTLSGGLCDGIPAGPSFASIGCRLAALRDHANAESSLGKLQTKLRKKADVLGRRADEAGVACAAGKAGKAGKRLKQIVKGLAAFRRKLSSKAAEKQVDPTVRALFMAEAEPIGADAQSLRDALACPGDQAARPFPSRVD
jgi:hypothetical protein